MNTFLEYDTLPFLQSVCILKIDRLLINGKT